MPTNNTGLLWSGESTHSGAFYPRSARSVGRNTEDNGKRLSIKLNKTKTHLAARRRRGQHRGQWERTELTVMINTKDNGKGRNSRL